MANVTYAQLTEATDVLDTDLLATFRGSGPLKRIQASVLKDYMGGDALLIDGSNAMLAAIQAYAGTEDAPGLGADGDEDTGLYWPSANTLAVATGGVKRGYWDSTGYTATLPLNLGASVDVASATSTLIGAATSNFVRITGTTTITSFDTVAPGVTRFVRFAGALTLTYNATSLIIPGAADITTVAGDTMMVVSEGGGNWRVEWYSPFAGAASKPAAFTVSLTAATPPTGVTYSTRTAYVMKIANLVFVSVKIAISSLGTGGSGQVYISGLPYASTLVRGDAAISSWEGISGLSSQIPGAWIEPTATRFELRKQGDATGNPMEWSDLSSGFSISLSCVYFAA